MTHELMMKELASALRHVLKEAPAPRVGLDAEDVFFDLSCRLIMRLAGKLTVVSTVAEDPIGPNALAWDSDDAEVRQVFDASNRIVQVMDALVKEGHRKENLHMSVIDAAVRLRRSCDPSMPTSSLLRELSRDAADMAESEEPTQSFPGVH